LISFATGENLQVIAVHCKWHESIGDMTLPNCAIEKSAIIDKLLGLMATDVSPIVVKRCYIPSRMGVRKVSDS